MKTKYFLANLIHIIFSSVLLFGSSITKADPCTANTSPGSASCTNLVINQSVGTINVNGAVSSDPAIFSAVLINSSGSVNSFNIGVGGSVSDNTSTNVFNNVGGTIASLINNGTIAGRITGSTTALYNHSGGIISNITNSGVIKASSLGIDNSSTINSLINSGSIYGGQYAIVNTGTIGTLTNLATSGSPTAGMYGGNQGIYNTGTITTLNNAQYDENLTLTRKLPTNYNIIINTAGSYGKLNLVAPTAGTTTNFGVYSGSRITTNSYSAVLNGLSASNLNATSGTYQGMNWTLTARSTFYDLTFSGTNTAVMSALNQTTTALQNAFTLQNTVLVNGFTYDCPIFDKNNVCVSVGGRYTTVNTDSVNSTGGLLIGAYRINNQIRAGAYIDQNVSTNSTGIVNVANASPMVGVFGAWNERQDGTGTEIKVSAGYGQKNTTMTRPVVDGTEAGSGSSTLTSHGVQAIGKYGFAVADKTIVSPYAGLRYTQNNMGGYTEGSSSSVTAPLTYSAVNTNATTVVAGLGANYKVMPDVTLLASAGLENDLNTNNGTYSATGLYGINPINFNSNPVRTRATASAGAYYDLAKNQRVSLSYIFRQEQFQGVNTNAGFLTYTVGL